MEGLLQPTHLMFILLIVLIIFGPGKLPDLGRGLGKGIREFKDALRGGAGGAQGPEARVRHSRTGESEAAGSSAARAAAVAGFRESGGPCGERAVGADA